MSRRIRIIPFRLRWWERLIRWATFGWWDPCIEIEIANDVPVSEVRVYQDGYLYGMFVDTSGRYEL